MSRKTLKKITIEVSVATHGKLCGMEEKVAKILRLNAVSHEQMINVILAISGLEDALTDLALEGRPK